MSSCSLDVTIVTSRLAAPLIASASQAGSCIHHQWKLLVDHFIELIIKSLHDLYELVISQCSVVFLVIRHMIVLRQTQLLL